MFQIASSAVEHGAGAAAEHHGGLGVVPHHFKASIGGLTVHMDTLVSTWITMGLVILLALMVSGALRKSPDKKQTVAEALVEFVEGLVHSQIGKDDALRYIPLVGSIFVFVLFGNWLGLIPWRLLHLGGVPLEIASPTNDLNTTGGLALIALIAYLYYGIRKKGMGYFKHYFTPNPLFFPLNFMEDFTRPLSLAFRLFGNIMGGEIVLAVLLLLAPWFVPLPLFAFEVFVGFIQAFIFAILTAAYIGLAVAEHDHDEEHGHEHIELEKSSP